MEIFVLERGPDLLAERHQEPVVEHGERVPGLPDHDERSDGVLVANHRERSGIRVGPAQLQMSTIVCF